MAQAELTRWLIALAVTLGVWLVGGYLARALLRTLVRWLHRTPTDLDDLLLLTLRPHVPMWFLALGLVLGARFAALPAPAIAWVDRGAQALLFLSITFAAASFLARLVQHRASTRPEALAATTLTQNAVRLSVIVLGLMVVVSNLGIAITPILTALGVGSLAVALALQPTLANLFAGFHVTLARHIRVGDFVELESGQQGYIVDIGWRSTQIRELPNNLIVVPNARIAEIIVKNYTLPEKEQAVLVQVGVSYGSNLDHVERVTLEVGRDVMRTVAGGVPEFEPFIRYHTFGDSSIDFTVILRAREFVDRYLVTHEFVRRLHRRYAAEGIEIPFPQRVLHEADRAGRARAGPEDRALESAAPRPGR